MDKMPYYVPPYPEETHYSHTLRLAKLNGFDSFIDFANQYLTFSSKRIKNISHDSSCNLAPFFATANPNSTYSKYILDTTSYPYHAMFMNNRKRINIVNKMFLVDNRFKYYSTMDKKNICYCPDCMNEAPYYRRLHQIPVVKFCPIHNKPLYKYTGKKNHELDLPIQGEAIDYMLDEMAEIQVAKFVQELIQSNLDIPTIDFQEVILKKINEFGGVDNVIEALYDSCFMAVLGDKKNIKYLLKNNIKREKKHELELTIIMVFLFDNFTNFLNYYSSFLSECADIDINGNVLESVFLKEDYDLISDYRDDLISIKHNICGHTFVTTPYAITYGWMCPFCSKKMSDEAFQNRMVQYYENGDYELVSAASTLDDRMTIRHKECGIETHPIYLNFLFSGHVCRCKRRLNKADVQKVVESYGDFELIKYIKADEPIEIKCNQCGNTIKYNYYSKDIKFRCNVCNPVHRTNINCKGKSLVHRNSISLDQIKSGIADLVGDKYDVLDVHSRISDGKYEISLRHNECGREYNVAYRLFMEGKGRCDCEGQKAQATDSELKRYISDISGHRYICIDDTVNRESVTIKDTVTGELHKMKYWLIVQELVRPTSSNILPCETKNPNALRPQSAPMLFMEYLRTTYGHDGVFFSRDITYNASKAWIASTLNMFLQQGLVKHIGAEIYAFDDIEPEWDKIVKLFYIQQNNTRYGCTYGRSFLQEIGIEVEHPPVYTHIMSNRKGRVGSAKSSQKVQSAIRSIGPVSVRFKGAPCDITEENYKILQVADYFCGHHNQNYPPLNPKEMALITDYISNVPMEVAKSTLCYYPEEVKKTIISMLIKAS